MKITINRVGITAPFKTLDKFYSEITFNELQLNGDVRVNLPKTFIVTAPFYLIET